MHAVFMQHLVFRWLNINTCFIIHLSKQIQQVSLYIGIQIIAVVLWHNRVEIIQHLYKIYPHLFNPCNLDYQNTMHNHNNYYELIIVEHMIHCLLFNERVSDRLHINSS